MKSENIAASPYWLTVPEAADYLRVSKDWIYRAAEAGTLTGRKVGRSWRFSHDALNAVVKESLVYYTKPLGQSRDRAKGVSCDGAFQPERSDLVLPI